MARPTPYEEAAARVHDAVWLASSRSGQSDDLFAAGYDRRSLILLLDDERSRTDDSKVALDAVARRVRSRIVGLSQSGGDHVYGRGGIHADATRCGACGRLHALLAIEALLPAGARDREGHDA